MVQCLKNVNYVLNRSKKSKGSSTKRETKSKRISFTNFERINHHAAGIDVSSTDLWVCVPPEETEDNVRQFGVFTCDLHELSNWLHKHNVTTVALESTSVYWIPVFQRLELDGFKVLLVNARHIKNVPGRPKTDKLDCQWIQRLHTFGLLQGSFRPDDEVCKLRVLLRHRDNLIAFAATYIQHIQKALHQMNLLLDTVISDISGVTGMKILEAILRGERDPNKLARLKDHRIHSSETEIAKSLEGDYREEHLFVLRQSLEFYKYTQQQIHSSEKEVQTLLDSWEKVIDSHVKPLPPSRCQPKQSQQNQLTFDVRTYLYELIGVDLTQVPGFQASTVITLLSEIGKDLSKFPTEKHFSSWLGVCPCPDISGGKVLKHKTKKVQSRAAKAFRLAARACSKSRSYLGAFYQRMKARIGGPKAITATAHKLAIIFYHMVKNKVAYKELGIDYYERYDKEQTIEKLKKKAQSLGFELVATTN